MPSKGAGVWGSNARGRGGNSGGRAVGASSHPLLLLFYSAALEFTAHVRLRCGTAHWVSAHSSPSVSVTVYSLFVSVSDRAQPNLALACVYAQHAG